MSNSESGSESTSDSNNGSNNLPHNNSLPDTGMADGELLQIFGELIMLLAILGIKRRK
ncbi:hypothetical protein WOSG25_070030 [Weissella oryzae SG25]|uniref:Gram-positive cocci surface proteins LPxTG domain-containing protein n=2 Tax=Weissella TaxID=46255 RepID=A0A069D0Z4_WEIOS|nr:hypothetical protein WOSG25_070030 [Weissella oryzae SG25]